MKEFKIEKNIPLPAKRSNLRVVYPFSEMEVGDSFIVGEYSKGKMACVLSSANSWSRYWNKNYQFTARRTEDDKIRIWRIK
jgi:hypothetical protein